MASVDWKKYRAGSLSHYSPHFDEEKRRELTHANKHIDPEMSVYNLTLGTDNWKDCCDKLAKRVKEVDKEHPPKRVKKDRVTTMSLYTVCPKEIEERGIPAVHEYFEKVHERFVEYFGEENVGGTFCHLDEQHTYIDAKTQEERESLYHAHTFVACYVDTEITRTKTVKKKDDEGKAIKEKTKVRERLVGINAKNFSTRQRMKEVNKIMEEICNDYDIEWHTGEGKNFETVETLKAKSAYLEAEEAGKHSRDLYYQIETQNQIIRNNDMILTKQLITKKDFLDENKDLPFNILTILKAKNPELYKKLFEEAKREIDEIKSYDPFKKPNKIQNKNKKFNSLDFDR